MRSQNVVKAELDQAEAEREALRVQLGSGRPKRVGVDPEPMDAEVFRRFAAAEQRVKDLQAELFAIDTASLGGR